MPDRDDRAKQILADRIQEALELTDDEALTMARAYFRAVDGSRFAAAE